MAQASNVSGIIQIDGAPVQRTVRAFGYGSTLHDVNGEEVTLSKSLGHATSNADTGEYTIDLLAGYGQEVFVVAFDDYGADFTPDLAMAPGERVHPTTPNGHVFECAGAGTLPTEEPTWIVDTETSQLYGTASMIARPFYRPMVHGPIMPEVVMPEEPEAPALPTVIGEAFGGGFYAGDIQDGGLWYKLIVADIDGDAYGFPWGGYNVNWPAASSVTDGPGNTESMRGDSRFEAGNYCLDWRGGGFDDWYMPAKAELTVIFTNLGPNQAAAPEGFKSGQPQAFHSAGQYYWASTQTSSMHAWGRRFSDGQEYDTSKYRTSQRVRSVRRLEFTP